MKYLLDTHILLWYVNDDVSRLKNILIYINDENNEIFVSIASLWEIAIKTKINKLTLKIDLSSFISNHIYGNNFTILDINKNHIIKLSGLDLFHKDPFDRILISQSLFEDIPIISIDEKFDLYKIKRLF